MARPLRAPLSGFLFAFSIANDAVASGLRVMTFNMMCIVCGHGDEIGPLSEWMARVADTINATIRTWSAFKSF